MLRDIREGKAPDLGAAARIVAGVSPDILLLIGVDWDYGLEGGRALRDLIAEAGADYPHLFALRPNTGMATGLDLDGDGRLGGPRDAQGFGYFAGQGGMLLLSRLPIDRDAVRDFSAILWREVPGADLPAVDGAPFPSEAALAAQRLSHTGHWDVPVILSSGGRLHLLCFAAGPPVFDGPEDRNGLRNAGEVLFWVRYLDRALEAAPPAAPVVVLGGANLDPLDGDGRHEAIAALLAHPRLQDPAPAAEEGAGPAQAGLGVNAGHAGDPALDTADWNDDGPGNLRVEYVLPDASAEVSGSGLVWAGPFRHALVWVDLTVPPGG